MIVFRRQHDGSVAISKDAMAVFDHYRQLEPTSPEAGGVLLGRFIRDALDIVIDMATTPGEGDKAHRYSFRRARTRTQALINQAWKDSGGTRNYLGEWHTHPEDDPSPSSTDLRNWLRLHSMAIYEQGSLLFVIVGRTNIRMWEVDRAHGHIVQLVMEVDRAN